MSDGMKQFLLWALIIIVVAHFAHIDLAGAARSIGHAWNTSGTGAP